MSASLFRLVYLLQCPAPPRWRETFIMRRNRTLLLLPSFFLGSQWESCLAKTHFNLALED